MLRWTSLIGAMLLVLMLWTGEPAHAAEPLACAGLTIQSPDCGGEQDQVPSCPQGCATHHCCSSHQAATPVNNPLMGLSLSKDTANFTRHEVGIHGHGPGSHLRPPIA